jgi:hypothetical protein
METADKDSRNDKGFDPLQMIGFFWLFFGIVIMLATFFITATPRVPLSHGIITNVAAAALLIVTGGLCILKAKRKVR